MKMALVLAEQGRGWTSPNPMVGAVIVKDNNVVGKGFHQAAGGPHAEIHALKEAGDKARGATLYVTLEPCNHKGRTPPCTQAILKSGIKRVVAGMKDPNPRVTGGGLAFLKSQGLDVSVGVCEDACRRLNEIFIKYVTTSLPFVILKCATTLDGRIATRTGDSKWITNPLSRQFVHELRHTVDAIMVGIGTVVKDNPQLTTRLEGRRGSDPLRIVLDTHLSISPDARLLHLGSDSDTLIVTGRSASAEKKRILEKPGVRFLALDDDRGQIDLTALVSELGRMGITSLLIEGGSRINGSALRAHIVDKIYMFYAPKIYGGDDGVPVCAGPGVNLMKESLSLKDISVHRFADDVMIEGYLKHQE
ncbi:MAG: bifunctional diaminohydroxyphosphoribosylaminopyrimidine deaminase/5-amino-6-(5-phosphoribosylamino)uracil reductase RibD [Deltaproteobacteria bacterium]|nr:bifunctional diaminohydroxyphosphoribosylaminopyrimidine deaminase/5-amino-6-(5-phosphoribosylamino)uracil reductase RibD [Deltaproteobacteria bacterium]MBW2018863.1 bifunctional diaminohydroxyphosphoribosylaminopyrimidine deaminase/5-amino-6-(5-phosphoribosylamino)uracil reductase RibD [Deltaproteobacteria bacterium]MBW2073618.1 bifunctional diaminohydroxyphosphoribosylaminopyrimidine deaminase/5-amino-6-(5-phosphoribosylamino)uracil reductase RibD [Deltaproteobacteria bacterium]